MNNSEPGSSEESSLPEGLSSSPFSSGSDSGMGLSDEYQRMMQMLHPEFAAANNSTQQNEDTSASEAPGSDSQWMMQDLRDSAEEQIQLQQAKREKKYKAVKEVSRKEAGEKTEKKKKPLKFSKTTIIIFIVAVLFLAAILSVVAYKAFTVYRFKEPAVYSVMGMDFEVPVGSTAKIDSEGQTVLTQKDGMEMIADEAGIYFTESNKMLTVLPMAYYTANQRSRLTATQVLPLTEVSTEYGRVTFEKDGKSLTEEGEFMHDGNNIYINLRAADLYIGDEKITTLSPLSYVMASYRNWVAYRDQGDGEYVYIPLDAEHYEEVKMYFAQDDLTIICDRDRAVSQYDNFMLNPEILHMDETLQ